LSRSIGVEAQVSIVKILAPLTGGARDAIVLESAFAAAAPFAAHVVALFVRPDPAEAMPFFGEGISAAVLQEVVDAARDAADKASRDAQALLAKVAAVANADVTAKPEKRDRPSASFREVQGNFADRVAQASRLADLVVFGPLKSGDKPGLGEAFEAALLEAGRPVLLTAQGPQRNFVGRIAIGCDGSVASAHAVTASLPYLKIAASVELFTVKRGEECGSPCDEVREYLSLNGIACSERLLDAGQRPTGEAVLDAASQCGADLLVLGGYGHSRLRQAFVTGVTRHVVSHAELPLFLVH
jgi:nucleotide-binding universal stress UspA family protein